MNDMHPRRCAELAAWLLLFMRALQQQKCRLAVKVEREKNALAALPELAVKILDYVRD